MLNSDCGRITRDLLEHNCVAHTTTSVDHFLRLKLESAITCSPMTRMKHIHGWLLYFGAEVSRHYMSFGKSIPSAEACHLQAGCTSCEKQFAFYSPWSLTPRVVRLTISKYQGICCSNRIPPGVRASYGLALDYIYSEQQFLAILASAAESRKATTTFCSSGDGMSHSSDHFRTSLPCNPLLNVRR